MVDGGNDRGIPTGDLESRRPIRILTSHDLAGTRLPVDFLDHRQHGVAFEVADDVHDHVIRHVVVLIEFLDRVTRHGFNGRERAEGRQGEGMPLIQDRLSVPLELFLRTGKTLRDLFENDPLFLLELVRGQGRVKEHVRLNLHSLADVLRRRHHHVVGVEISRGGIIVAADPVDVVVELFLVPARRSIEQQMFEHVAHAAGLERLVGRSNLHCDIHTDHRQGGILDEQHLHAVVQLVDGDPLGKRLYLKVRLSRRRLSLRALLLGKRLDGGHKHKHEQE